MYTIRGKIRKQTKAVISRRLLLSGLTKRAGGLAGIAYLARFFSANKQRPVNFLRELHRILVYLRSSKEYVDISCGSTAHSIHPLNENKITARVRSDVYTRTPFRAPLSRHFLLPDPARAKQGRLSGSLQQRRGPVTERYMVSHHKKGEKDEKKKQEKTRAAHCQQAVGAKKNARYYTTQWAHCKRGHPLCSTGRAMLGSLQGRTTLDTAGVFRGSDVEPISITAIRLNALFCIRAARSLSNRARIWVAPRRHDALERSNVKAELAIVLRRAREFFVDAE